VNDRTPYRLHRLNRGNVAFKAEDAPRVDEGVLRDEAVERGLHLGRERVVGRAQVGEFGFAAGSRRLAARKHRVARRRRLERAIGVPQLIGKRKEMGLVGALEDLAVVVDVREVDESGDAQPFAPRARCRFDRAETPRKRELAVVIEMLPAQHDDRVAIERGVDLGDLTVGRAGARIDSANAGDELRF